MVTFTGRAVAGAAAAAVGAAAWTGYPQLAALSAACLAALLTAVISAPPPSLALSAAWNASRITAGDTAYLDVSVVNRSRFAAREVRLSASDDGGGLLATSVVSRLPGGGVHVERIPWERVPRGVFRVASLAAESTDPLGLIRHRLEVVCVCTLVTWPRTTGPAPDDVRRSDDDAGITTGRVRTPGAAFHALRRYDVGDDVRHIHWLSTARTGRPMVRDMVAPSPRQQLVVLDTAGGAYPDEESFEIAVEICASIAVAAQRTQDLDLRTSGSHSTRYRRHSPREVLLDELAAIRLEPGDPWQVPARRTDTSPVTVVSGVRGDARDWPRRLGTRDLTLVEVADGSSPATSTARGIRRFPTSSLQDFDRVWGRVWGA